MRAIEQGLPMVRSANTGISAIIDPYGGIISKVGMGREGYLDGLLPERLDPTLYSSLGTDFFDLLLIGTLVLTILILIIITSVKKVKKAPLRSADV
jgi:apolipoprotein N-acyltransferase